MHTAGMRSACGELISQLPSGLDWPKCGCGRSTSSRTERLIRFPKAAGAEEQLRVDRQIPHARGFWCPVPPWRGILMPGGLPGGVEYLFEKHGVKLGNARILLDQGENADLYSYLVAAAVGIVMGLVLFAPITVASVTSLFRHR